MAGGGKLVSGLATLVVAAAVVLWLADVRPLSVDVRHAIESVSAELSSSTPTLISKPRRKHPLADDTQKRPSPPDQTDRSPAPVSSAPRALDQIFCAEVQQRTTRADCDDYAAQARSAKAGIGAFHAPNPMVRGQTVTLQLALSFKPATPGAQTPDEVVSGLPGTPVEFKPSVGRHMAAELAGEGFTVTPSGPQHRELTPGSVTTWEWTIRADREGDHILVLKTTVEALKADGGFAPLASTTKDQTIHVTVGKADAVRDWLDGLPGWMKSVQAVIVGLTALLGAGFALFKLFRKPSKDRTGKR